MTFLSLINKFLAGLTALIYLMTTLPLPVAAQAPDFKQRVVVRLIFNLPTKSKAEETQKLTFTKLQEPQATEVVLDFIIEEEGAITGVPLSKITKPKPAEEVAKEGVLTLTFESVEEEEEPIEEGEIVAEAPEFGEQKPTLVQRVRAIFGFGAPTEKVITVSLEVVGEKPKEVVEAIQQFVVTLVEEEKEPEVAEAPLAAPAQPAPVAEVPAALLEPERYSFTSRLDNPISPRVLELIVDCTRPCRIYNSANRAEVFVDNFTGKATVPINVFQRSGPIRIEGLVIATNAKFLDPSSPDGGYNPPQAGGAPAACAVPDAPSGLSVEVVSSSVLRISWVSPIGGTTVRIKQATVSGGPYAQVGTDTESPFTDTGLTAATTYYHVLTSVSGTCESGNSAEVSGTTSS